MMTIWMARAGAALAGIASAPAFAHHMDGNALPATLGAGLLSGLGHPVIGLDHLAFVIAIGMLAASWRRPALPLAAFIAMTAAGCLIHVAAFDLPGVELAVALSVLIAGLALLGGGRLGTGGAALLLGVAGILHGYAYGESIVGAEPTPLLAYLAGFILIQGAIVFGARVLAGWMISARPGGWTMARRAAGVVVMAVAVAAVLA